MHILMVLTSHDRLGASREKTGFWKKIQQNSPQVSE